MALTSVLITLSLQYDSFDDFINELLGRFGSTGASNGPIGHKAIPPHFHWGSSGFSGFDGFGDFNWR